MSSHSPARPTLPALAPIGVIHTPFVCAEGTPIQASGAGEAQGSAEIYPEFAGGLRDLDGFERIWLIYCLDRIAEPKLLVKPFLDPNEHGIFATRSPARPNRIGMSPVRLLGMQGNRLTIAGVDMLDGTPLLDIKPYVPDFDHFAVERIGWYQGKSAQGAVADNRFTPSGRSAN